jgi:hypothetical protein
VELTKKYKVVLQRVVVKNCNEMKRLCHGAHETDLAVPLLPTDGAGCILPFYQKAEIRKPRQ